MNEEKNLKDEIIKEIVEMTESFTKNTMEEIIIDEFFKIMLITNLIILKII